MAQCGTGVATFQALQPVNTGARALPAAAGRSGAFMEMEDRIAVLERDVDAIESELAVIRRDRANADEVGERISRIELELLMDQR